MSGRGVTEQDLGGLVYFARRLREETHGCGVWDEPGIVVAVEGMRNWSLEVALEQILRRATDPEARTPKAMLQRQVSVPLPSERPGAKRGNPHRGEVGECKRHVGQWADNCASCKAERSVKHERPDVDSPSPDLPRTEDVNPRLAERLHARGYIPNPASEPTDGPSRPTPKEENPCPSPH